MRRSTAATGVVARSWAMAMAFTGLLGPGGGCERSGEEAAPGPAEVGAPREVDAAPAAPPVLPGLGPSGLESIEVVTGGASAAAPLPLVIALHDLGEDPEGFARLFDGFDREARLVFPRGPLPHEKGRAWFLPGPDAAVDRMVTRAADSVAALADEVAASRPTRGKAIVTGVSQGGTVALVAAARQPERFAAVVPVGAWLPQAAWPAEGRAVRGGRPTVRALGGVDDDHARATDLRRYVVKLRMMGLDASARLYADTGRPTSPAMSTDLLRLLGALVAGTAEPPACAPCPGDSMDPEACSLCPAGPPSEPAAAASAAGPAPAGPRAAGAEVSPGEAPPGRAGPDDSLEREGPTSRFAAGAGGGRDSLSREEVQRTFHRNMAPIRFCHERRAETRPGLSGRVSVRFVVAADGSVASAEVASSTLGDAEVEDCVRRAVTRVSFPPPRGGAPVTVTYPFTFASAQR